MQKLNYPSFNFSLKNNKNKAEIFDIVRKKFIILTPEEWVRQNTIHYLVYEKHYPLSLISVERALKLNNLTKRYDIVVFNPKGEVILLVECKAPSIKITQNSFDQIARYNMKIRSKYLFLTNGLEHYSYKIDYDMGKYYFTRELPSYNMLKNE